MQYVTRFERLAKQEGHLEGWREGGRELLLRLLERRFGSLPETIENQVRDATPEQLNSWADRVLDADALEVVFRESSI